MTFTKEEVYEQCKEIAPKYKFDPKLIYAVCLQESDKDKNGNFDPSVCRLEPGYYSRYVESKNELASTSEALLACSWGIMQMMGLSLKEIKYFDWYYTRNPANIYLLSPMSEIAVPKAINYYCVNLDLMITWGCEWMAVKRKLTKSVESMLDAWNGCKDGSYHKSVMAKYKQIV